MWALKVSRTFQMGATSIGGGGGQPRYVKKIYVKKVNVQVYHVYSLISSLKNYQSTLQFTVNRPVNSCAISIPQRAIVMQPFPDFDVLNLLYTLSSLSY